MKYTNLWKHMHDTTDRSIEKPAVMELILFIENQTEVVMLQSVKELEKMNRRRKIQGVYEKNRIDRDCIRSAITVICSSDYLQEQKNKGGNNKEEGEKNVEHTPKENNREVETV